LLGLLSYSDLEACNWQSRNGKFTTYDSCNSNTKKASIGGYVYFNSNLLGCFKYQWKVNGNVVSTRNILTYAITQNGTYSISCKVTDTCNNCDTTFSSSKTISCIPANCNWSKVYLAYTNVCNVYKFEVAGTIDTCLQTLSELTNKKHSKGTPLKPEHITIPLLILADTIYSLKFTINA